MRRLRPLVLVLLAAGCGIDIVGIASSDQPDTTPPTVEASTSDVATADVEAPTDAEADAELDASLDAHDAADARDAADANPCALCPNGTAQKLCVANACVATRRVFVTNGGFAANFGGAAGADAKCQDAAKAANLGGTWYAWIGVGGPNVSDPSNHFVPTTDAYRLLDGTKVAESTSDLFTGIEHDVDLDETGAVVTGQIEVWTGVNGSGQNTSQTCNGWTSNSTGDTGYVGYLNQSDSTWTTKYTQTCDRVGQHLYCFEQ